MSTFKLRANELTGQTGLSVYLYPPGGTLANSGGDALTESSGLFSATVAESLSGLHDYFIYKSGTAIYRGQVFCGGSVWIADQPAPEYYPPVTRSLDDTKALEFWWPGNPSLTAQVSIDGGSFATAQTPTIGSTNDGGFYQYTIPYAAADRPTAEGRALYKITDGTSTKYLSLVVTPSLAGLGILGTGQATVDAPVSERGKIRQIFIGDDYLATKGRAFRFTVDEPTGFVAATSTCHFGGEDSNGNTWLVAGSITDNGATWTLAFDLSKTDTAIPEGIYEWTVEVKSADGAEHTVVAGGDTKLRRKYT